MGEATSATLVPNSGLVRIPLEHLLRYVDVPPITQVTAKAQRVLKFKPTDFAHRFKGIL